MSNNKTLTFKQVFGSNFKASLQPPGLQCDNPMLYHSMMANSTRRYGAGGVPVDDLGHQAIGTRTRVYGAWQVGTASPWLNMLQWSEGAYRQCLPLIFPYIKLILAPTKQKFNFSEPVIQSRIEPFAGFYKDIYGQTLPRNNTLLQYSRYLMYRFLSVAVLDEPVHFDYSVQKEFARKRTRRPDIVPEPGTHTPPCRDLLIRHVKDGYESGPLVKINMLGVRKGEEQDHNSPSFIVTAKWIIDRVNSTMSEDGGNSDIIVIFKEKYFDLVVCDYPPPQWDEGDDPLMLSLTADYRKEGLIIYRLLYTNYTDLWIRYTLATRGSFKLDDVDWVVAYGLALQCVSHGFMTSGQGYESLVNAARPPLPSWRGMYARAAAPLFPLPINVPTPREVLRKATLDMADITTLVLYTDWESQPVCPKYEIVNGRPRKVEVAIYFAVRKGLVRSDEIARLGVRPYTWPKEPEIYSSRVFERVARPRSGPVGDVGTVTWDHAFSGHVIRIIKPDRYHVTWSPVQPEPKTAIVAAPLVYDLKNKRYGTSLPFMAMAAEFQMSMMRLWLARGDMLVTGNPGTGKTYVMPLLFYHFERMFGGFAVFEKPASCERVGEWSVTASDLVPGKRRDAVLSVPRRIILENTFKLYLKTMGLLLGTANVDTPMLVDARYGDAESLKSSNYTKGVETEQPKLVLSVTDVTLEMIAQTEPDEFSDDSREDYKIDIGPLLIDEIHEQQINVIALISVAKHKRHLVRNIILITATVEGDLEEVRRAFPGIHEVDLPTPDTPPHRRDVRFLPWFAVDPETPWRQRSAALVKSMSSVIMAHPPDRGSHAVVFLATKRECNDSAEALQKELGSHFIVSPLHGGISSKGREKVEELLASKDRSLIVLGTNYLESSVTLDNLQVVYDYGRYYDVDIGVVTVIDESMMVQRQGRVGRVMDGRYFGLFKRFSLTPRTEASRAIALASLPVHEHASVPLVKAHATDRGQIYRLIMVYSRYGIALKDSYMPPHDKQRLDEVMRIMKMGKFHPDQRGVKSVYFNHTPLVEEFGYSIIPMINSTSAFARALPEMLRTDSVRITHQDFAAIRPFCTQLTIQYTGNSKNVVTTVNDIERVIEMFENREAIREARSFLGSNAVVRTIRSTIRLRDLMEAAEVFVSSMMCLRTKSLMQLIRDDMAREDGVMVNLENIENILKQSGSRRGTIPLFLVQRYMPVFPVSEYYVYQNNMRFKKEFACPADRSPQVFMLWKGAWLDARKMSLFGEYVPIDSSEADLSSLPR